MHYRNATLNDLNTIKSLLDRFQLPSSDCEAHISNFMILEDKAVLVAIGAIEAYDNIGLLRSLVVDTHYQHQGIGKQFVDRLKDNAARNGIYQLYLLTETAVDFFKSQGFVEIDRNLAPQEIKATQQYSQLCPDSACLLRYTLEQTV